MKLSKYIKEIEISEEEVILYSLVSREYYVYSKADRGSIWNFLNQLNKNVYTADEKRIIEILYKKEIIIDDRIDELRKLEHLENQCCYQSNCFFLTVYATNACNFRCTYCTQEHVTRNLETKVHDEILELLEVVSRKKGEIYITWFGGEPLMQYEKIRSIMRRAVEICKKNHCRLNSNIVTNGYLLTEDKIEEFKELAIKSVQITVDGGPQIHDKRRILVGGQGTYKKIVNNINCALEQEISVVLRINIDKETFSYPIRILEEINPEFRKRVKVSISNLFQEEEKSSTYEIFKKAIEMGYLYTQRKNNYMGCTTCGNNALVVDTNGDILFCTSTSSIKNVVGKLEEGGKIIYKNMEQRRQELMASARDNEKCRTCIELPLCIGRCRLARIEKNQGCMGKQNDGLSIEERAKLDFYYDKIKIEERENNDE